MIKPWTVLSTREVIRDRFITHTIDTCERADGTRIPTYHVLDLPIWTVTVPLTADGSVILVREYRHPGKVVMTGLPGGGGEPGETDPKIIAERELTEETGFVPKSFHALGTCYPNPAIQTNQLHIFLALGCEKRTGQTLDPAEEIEIVQMPLSDFEAYEDFDIQHCHHAAALFYLSRFFAKHPDLKPV
ncbi:MAG: NUDIX hydrolase [Pseudomonadota bacterium]